MGMLDMLNKVRTGGADRRGGRRRVPRAYWIAVAVVLVACVSLTVMGRTLWSGAGRDVRPSSTLLPGEQVWKQGASSLLFGTNDTYEWSTQNIETMTSVQSSLRQAGFTLIRTFFPDNAPDATIDQRVRTIEQSGAQCLGVITNISNADFDRHLVSYLGPKCLLYEFGNEPDFNGISADTYLKRWRALVPVLRSINPAARFIGPVTYNDQGNHGFMRTFLEGVKDSGVLPDAVSFHWYPCWKDSRDACLAKASSYADVARGVEDEVSSILGKSLPVGITEWNFDPSAPPALGDDADFITKFSETALRSMASAGVAFACQYDAASYAGYGRLDMFDVATGKAKPQYHAIAKVIAAYRPANSGAATAGTTATRPGQLISRGQPAFCSDSDVSAGGPGAINDGHYGNWGFWRSRLDALPGWCAIQLPKGASRILVSWASDYSFDYISDASLAPQNYTISVSADSTDGADGTWRTVVPVTGNHARVREHLLPFTGESWIKITVTKGQPAASQPYAAIDEIDVFDMSSDDALRNTFFFSGDALTGIAYNRFDENQPSFAELVHAATPGQYPAMEDGGMDGWSTDGVAGSGSIDEWLALNPDVHYWLLQWGTNDAFSQLSPDRYRADMQTIVDKIRAAGRVPILARLPAINAARPDATAINQRIDAYNVVIDQVTAANHLLPGPDMHAVFSGHLNTYLLPDGIYPSSAGAQAMNQAWFDALKSEL
jgi:lysophospholipase L1-like esterase